MKKAMIAAGALAAAAAVPVAASAQSYYGGYDPYRVDGARRTNELGGAVIGGGLGAVAGAAIAGRGDKTTGAIIGGALGAIVGSQVAKGQNNKDFGYQQPYRQSYGYPSYGYSQPRYGYSQPRYGYGQSYGYSRPSHGYGQSYGYGQSSYGRSYDRYGRPVGYGW